MEVGQKLELEVDEDVDEVEVEQQLEVEVELEILFHVFCKQIWHGQRAYHSSDGWIELVQIYSHHSRMRMWENK